MSEDAHDSYNDVPSIQAQCSGCGFLYDLKFGLSCPACHHIGVRWARLVNEAVAHQYGAYAKQELRMALDSSYPGRLCSPYSHTPEEQCDITWLEKLYCLEDNR